MRKSGALVGFAALAVGLVAVVLWAGAVAAGAAGAGELVAQPSLGSPALTFLGASPAEAPGEVWATAANPSTIVRYTEAGGWETQPQPVDSSGAPIAGLSIAQGGPDIGRTTPAGGVVVAAVAAETQLLVARDPGGTPHEVPAPTAVLGLGEALFGESPMLTAVEDPGGHTGAFVVPALSGTATQGVVLDFDGTAWSREPICIGLEPGTKCAAPPASFRVVSVDASSNENAWLLGKGLSGQGVTLFSREAGGGPAGETVWRQRSLGEAVPGSLFAQAEPQFPQPAPAPPLKVQISPRVAGQPLTVTEKGVWVDTQLNLVGGEKGEATFYYDLEKKEVTGSWCNISAATGLCRQPLTAELSAGDGRSFAWPPASPAEPFGRRVITGIGNGAILSFQGEGFERISLAGGNAGTTRGAALIGPEEGWLGANPPLHLVQAGSSQQEPSGLSQWPVPFRRPLTAVAAAPEAAIGAIGSEALAVGLDGEAARYISGQGWQPEPLLNGSGVRQTPTLRGVAWPEAGRAYAVGDEAAMWVWRKATGLWEPDPAEPPNLVRANFTAIAFDPNEPNRGYAVGKQGMLLAYGRRWTQETLPSEIPAEANFTAVTFAGDEALATWKYPLGTAPGRYEGGLIVNDGSGWQADSSASEALAGEAPQLIAGLPDGGAVAVSIEGKVIEREAIGAAWFAVSAQGPRFPTAVTALRESGKVRALVATESGSGGAGSRTLDWKTDEAQVFDQPPSTQPPLLTEPYPLPENGYLFRQTATGWRDEEHEAFPRPEGGGEQTEFDLPVTPDPILALLANPEGGGGWALGGATGSGTASPAEAAPIQTAAAMRFGEGTAAPANVSASAIPTEAAAATFAIGGEAQCAGPCADLLGTGIGPDRWLRAAVGTASEIGGVRGFLYTGPSVAANLGSTPLSTALSEGAFAREESAYARRLAANAGGLPVYAAPAASDLDRTGTLATFSSVFSGFDAPLGTAAAPAGIVPLSSASATQAFYSFDSVGAAGTPSVRVIVLDYSHPTMETAQRCWLAQQLDEAGVAGTPAIVVGDRDLGGQALNGPEDASQVVPILVTGEAPRGVTCPPVDAPAPGALPYGASAYFFDYPGENRAYELSGGGRSIPAFGSGTLGYVKPPNEISTEYLGASGFLLASIGAPNAANVATVTARLVPNIGALALDATDGTLLRRSQPALFEALARRPQAGTRCVASNGPIDCNVAPDPYAPIPDQCVGANCATGIFPEYAFSSSNPDIADFVEQDPATNNPRRVRLVNGKPVLDSHSGLLCAFNAGTTTVTVTTGGLSYSEPVTVQAGSVERPCGTTPLRNRPTQTAALTPPPLPPAPAPGFSTPPTNVVPPSPPTPTPVPAPTPLPMQTPSPPVVHHPPSPVPPPPTFSFFSPSPGLAPLVAIIPPPPPPAVQPTPPSGTSPVTQPAVSPEPEEQDEVAIDYVHHMAVHLPGARRAVAGAAGGQGSGGISPAYLLLAVGLLAVAAGGAAKRPRSPRYAYVSTNPRRSQSR